MGCFLFTLMWAGELYSAKTPYTAFLLELIDLPWCQGKPWVKRKVCVLKTGLYQHKRNVN